MAIGNRKGWIKWSLKPGLARKGEKPKSSDIPGAGPCSDLPPPPLKRWLPGATRTTNKETKRKGGTRLSTRAEEVLSAD